MCHQVSDRGGERCYGSLAVLWRLALTWWNPFPAKIPPATCGRLKKNHAFPPVALVVLEPQSRTCHVSAPKVKSSVHHITPLTLLNKTAFKIPRKEHQHTNLIFFLFTEIITVTKLAPGCSGISHQTECGFLIISLE